MANDKETPTMAIRFRGGSGRRKLKDALLRQPLIAGDSSLAKRLGDLVKVVVLKSGEVLTSQGGTDNDVYFILMGSVSIQANGREIAVRYAGEHVGEMALVDSTALRSASVVAREGCTAARLQEPQFSKLTSEYPDLWRAISVSLVQRLRERNKFHPAPRTQPVIFIGSSSEGARIAECIRRYLLRFPVITRLWCKDVFKPSETTIEDLMKLTAESDFAVIILTPDDITLSRRKKKASPRDNAIFELGLFMGALARHRTYIVTPRGVDIKIPTDLMGVTCLQYRHRGPGTLSLRLGPVKTQLRVLVEKHGPR